MNRNLNIVRRSLCGGWTLTEVLLVSVVFALLAAIALPVGLRQVEKAKEAGCVQKLRNLGVAHRTWRSENNDKLAPSTSTLAWWPIRHLYEAGAIKSAREMVCPAMTTAAKGAWYDAGTSSTSSEYYAVVFQQPLSYGVNTLAFNSTTPKGWGSTSTSTYRMFLGKEQYVPLFFDATAWQANGAVWSSSELKRQRFAFPHDERAGVLFLDGHVELLDRAGVDLLHPLGDHGRVY